MPVVHFETLGCKLNQIESESACKVFNDCGWQISVKPLVSQNQLSQQEILDTKLCVVNTCTVTAKAEQKCRRVIKLLLKIFPGSIVLVTGCYAQVEKAFIESMDPRIAVLPGTKKDILADLPELFQKKNFDFSGGPEKNIVFLKNLLNEEEARPPKEKFRLSTDIFFNHSRSSIKVQDGCGNNCSFCRIHIARGKPLSLDASTVLERVKKLEDAGQSEVVLTGVNLSQYRSLIPGSDRTGDFADLLEFLSENTSSIYFRISSLYPERIDERFIQVLKKSRVRPHFHLSVQSGSDSILESMNRPYKACDVLNAVKELNKIYDRPFIACDIIAGFPGESDEDFDKTMELALQCNFTWIHAFPFSPRPGTAAYSMKGQVPQFIAHKRIQKLTRLADNNKQAYVRAFTGKTVKAIVEKRQDKLVRCVTENFLHAHLQLPEKIDSSYLAGKEISVKILGVSSLKECECECCLADEDWSL
ncbi:MAG: tRNA (N(6)-L-threonylcarbamoyladenosine(37)-C(2))-methylthiotransferase MtaB [Treponemataceae bacterium]|nr:tRNA (N(6)-L-threonylcarbamoyladenosine(37)-C(2))-methylthiotransferase MtaB [Treponemataceae bacterium]